MPRSPFDLSHALARRRHVLPPTYGLFYDEPVHIVRAEGMWMYDADGRAYLDAYNNVPVVGHCHPYVVEEMLRQARTLNTHTRYLTEKPLELAERLRATLPPEIDSIIFTCSGSEANDLAVRVSKTATGGAGFIVTEHAYHGTTETVSGMSPSSGTGRLGHAVYAVPAPVGRSSAERFLDGIGQCIERMANDGVRPAALLVDTIFSSDGIGCHPRGFLAEAAARVRAAGGLLIADEVQPGFGRTGEHMWGFQRHGVVPDIVTVGKPMGNGHPVAAMVTRHDVLAGFARQTRYFNTFGGNSVSCAVALAVLEVIEREQLMANARERGDELANGIAGIARRHPTVGDIRGAGLFLGVEIRANVARGLTARQEAARIVNEMRRQGVLIGLAGRNADVLKIRPPLPMAAAEAGLLLTVLDRCLAAGD